MDLLVQETKASQPARDNVGRIKCANKETKRRLHVLTAATRFVFHCPLTIRIILHPSIHLKQRTHLDLLIY